MNPDKLGREHHTGHDEPGCWVAALQDPFAVERIEDVTDVDLDFLGLDSDVHCSASDKVFDDVPKKSWGKPE